MSTRSDSDRPRRGRFRTRTLCCVAVLTALSAVIAYLCKFLTLAPTVRITFENLPIIMSGFVFGPVAGAVTGVTAEFISTLISQYGLGQMNPILTAAAGLIGAIAGIAAILTRGRKLPLRLVFAVFLAHVIGNMLVKTLGLYVWYKMPILPTLAVRVPLYAAIASAEYVLLLILLRSDGIRRTLGVDSECRLI